MRRCPLARSWRPRRCLCCAMIARRQLGPATASATPHSSEAAMAIARIAVPSPSTSRPCHPFPPFPPPTCFPPRPPTACYAQRHPVSPGRLEGTLDAGTSSCKKGEREGHCENRGVGKLGRRQRSTTARVLEWLDSEDCLEWVEEAFSLEKATSRERDHLYWYTKLV